VNQSRKPAALLLVGHGSHYSLDSSRPVHELARRARATADFSEVRVAFWKEEPFLHHAFDLVESETVWVVPVFTSLGYFTDQVVPRELGIDAPNTERDGRLIRYLPPIGSRPEMAEIVLARAREALGARGAPAETTLLVLGHGTDEHAGSGGVTYELAARLAAMSGFGSVAAAFLDQRPTLADALAGVSTRGAVVVPFFVSEGWHVGTTIPRDLARASGTETAGDRWIAYAKPVGTHPDIFSVVSALAEDARSAPREDMSVSATAAGGLGGSAHRVPTAPRGATPAAVRQAREWFVRWVKSAEGPRTFLETVGWADGAGHFEVRHGRDLGAPVEALRTYTDPTAAHEVASVTEEGRPRPLRTSPDLQRGWRFAGLDEEGLWELYANLYPAAPVHAFLHRREELRTVPFEVTAGRQTGMYAGVGRLHGTALAALVRERCGFGCQRVPIWRPSAAGADPFSERVRSDPYVVCDQPCSLLIAAARAALDPSETPG
jgi:sirohydrochlorin cobaltochelatase